MFGISRLTHLTNFALRKLTGQQTIESMIMNNRLRWLGHVVRMADERMPKRMMFAKLQTTRPAGGTKQRWKDCVQHDLRAMGVDVGWVDLARQRDKWHAATQEAVKKWEAEKNANEQKTYEDKKAGNGIKCTFRGCPFVAKNEKGLKSHWSQKHKYVEDTSSESDDSNDDAEEVAPRRPMTSTTPSATSTSNCSKYICPHCKKDCSSGSGLSSHLRHSKLCKAPAADGPK